MSDATSINLCILWEVELRKASRLIHEAHADGLTDEARGIAMSKAFSAATVALWGLTADHACVLVGSDEILKARKKQRRTTPTSNEQSSK